MLSYTIPQVRAGLQLFHLLDVRTFAKQSLSCCSRMEETTPPHWAKTVLVFSLVALLAKAGECGELVLPSLPLLVQRTEEREELVCGRVRALTGNRENIPVPAVHVSVE